MRKRRKQTRDKNKSKKNIKKDEENKQKKYRQTDCQNMKEGESIKIGEEKDKADKLFLDPFLSFF